jgi:nucleotide-binding universal stress UspA family protein
MNKPFEKILVYVDGSEESITAAQYGVYLAKTTGAELTAIYIINTRALDDLVRTRIFLQEEQEEYRRDLETDSERYLQHVSKMADEKQLPVKTIKTSGNVHSEIKKAVKEGDFDLLLVGEISHVRSRRDEFYNETERAMRSVPCSVLIVKDPDRVWDLYENLRD